MHILKFELSILFVKSLYNNFLIKTMNRLGLTSTPCLSFSLPQLQQFLLTKSWHFISYCPNSGDAGFPVRTTCLSSWLTNWCFAYNVINHLQKLDVSLITSAFGEIVLGLYSVSQKYGQYACVIIYDVYHGTKRIIHFVKFCQNL